ncbi:hypothetical protein RFI_13717 [Reticulomyxa filosa]|uniref:Uncharacterized protein n=1 Tax=Reticulomyxa filosa TaxID=46433 RepID=X6NCI0_RETFI|nr:hypothetical protein RFI_13717 [Reticulomyxa filosa]|eukprot:ETO23464.1 hypothetical protein RFI_13717 [Reticulomyxa filosa]
MVRTGEKVREMKEQLAGEWRDEGIEVGPIVSEEVQKQISTTKHGKDKDKDEEDKEDKDKDENSESEDNEESSTEVTRVLAAKSESPPVFVVSSNRQRDANPANGTISVQPFPVTTERQTLQVTEGDFLGGRSLSMRIPLQPKMSDDKEEDQRKSTFKDSTTVDFSLLPPMGHTGDQIHLTSQLQKTYDATTSRFQLQKDPIQETETKFIITGPPTDTTERKLFGTKAAANTDPQEFLKKFHELKPSRKKPVWADICCDPSVLEMVVEKLGLPIHPLTVEDCMSADCREKLEIFDHYLFLCIRVPVRDSNKTQRIAILVFKAVILTYHEFSLTVMDNTRTIIRRRHLHDKENKWCCPSPGWVCHAIIDGVVDALIPEVNRVVDEVQNLEQLVFMIEVDSQHELLNRFEAARYGLELYRSRLWPKSTLTHNLNNLDWRTFLQDVPAAYWRDINDHLSRMVDTVQIASQTLESLQNVFIAKVSMDMSDYANALNETVGRLGIVSTLFLPLIFITGLFGTNMWIPFQVGLTDVVSAENIRFGFVFVLSLMVVTFSATYILVKKSGWIAVRSRKQF